MEKGKAEVKNLYIAFPSYSYTFFYFSFFIHDKYITYRKFKHIWNIIFHTQSIFKFITHLHFF